MAAVNTVTSSVQPQAPIENAQQATSSQPRQPAPAPAPEAAPRGEEAARSLGLGRRVSRRV